MSEQRPPQALIDALNDCIDRLAAGENVESCVRRYPQFERDLRVLLESGLLARRVGASPAQVATVQARVRARVTQALNAPAPRRVSRPIWGGLARIAAMLVLVTLIGGAGIGALAQNSLPGDALYGVKRLTESVQISFSLNDSDLEAQFMQRRIDEARQLLRLGRTSEVTFEGNVERVEAFDWQVSGLTVRVLPDTVDAIDAGQIGEQVEIHALTTEQGELIALEIRRMGEVRPASVTVTPIFTETQRQRPTQTPTPTVETQRPTRTFTPVETQPQQRPTQEIAATLTLAQFRPPATITADIRPQRQGDVTLRPVDGSSVRATETPARRRGG